MVHAKITESKKPLKKLRRKQNQVLNKLSELSRRDLTKLQRLKANALITIEIHSRDVIDKMYKASKTFYRKPVNVLHFFKIVETQILLNGFRNYVFTGIVM